MTIKLEFYDWEPINRCNSYGEVVHVDWKRTLKLNADECILVERYYNWNTDGFWQVSFIGNTVNLLHNHFYTNCWYVLYKQCITSDDFKQLVDKFLDKMSRLMVFI